MTEGIHHVTAIASDPQTNIDFYAGVLGLRLVKRTVNFDDPGTYHLYYGDHTGTPGTLLTFFPWRGAARGRAGTGQASAIAFSVPPGTLGFWGKRLQASKVPFDGPATRIYDDVITLRDPDGMALELISHPEALDSEPWNGGTVPGNVGIRGIHGVTLAESGYEHTAALLTGPMGMRLQQEHGNRFRFATPGRGPGTRLDVVCLPDAMPGRMGAGTVHHVAWRAKDDEDQQRQRRVLLAEKLDVTPVLDRQYFHSVYFHEPGGVLFEIATDPPGFAIDEPVESLGAELKLPGWLEPHRTAIERTLPPLKIPGARG